MKGYGQKRYLQKIIGLIEKNDPSTTNVVLNGFEMIDAKLAVLAMALVNNTHLISLHLDGNSISDRGAGMLAYALQQNDTLEFLSLNDNEIQSAGAEALAAALHDNKTLTSLRLANNCIGNHGAKSLRKMLKRNKSIKEICIDDNSISTKDTNKFDDRRKSRDYSRKKSVGDTTAASTAACSEVTPCPSHHQDGSSSPDESTMRKVIEEGEMGNSGLEWSDASAGTSSIFGEELYMDNVDARKYIIGCDDDDDGEGDELKRSLSWNNLQSYMMSVQDMMGTSFEEDDLSVASDDQDPKHKNQAAAPKEEKKKKFSLFKKSRSNKKVYIHEEDDEP